MTTAHAILVRLDACLGAASIGALGELGAASIVDGAAEAAAAQCGVAITVRVSYIYKLTTGTVLYGDMGKFGNLNRTKS